MIEFRLIHDGSFWIAENDSITAKGKSLEELDRDIETMIRQNNNSEDHEPLTVIMTFDNVVIPEWIRQYSNHYFNRKVLLFSCKKKLV
ncbi:MAG: hypothetical protein A2161_00805 [Candidatus Schekmanbacteria bacterium RBG_13_48_7]|uniref:DUF1902 domain-containing protein n=1 Tax=Candidatus Schekmanbacteria bacterium RBG_13_48_7 TaxID=1817878 RepID=A0A1F7RI70_9BACT|nr:MAG: hypothetical protein A2161_00805 [Candidatus Schekmanbacteria bacterium RBG_13_48_7]